jgi:hypothetical protein
VGGTDRLALSRPATREAGGFGLQTPVRVAQPYKGFRKPEAKRLERFIASVLSS